MRRDMRQKEKKIDIRVLVLCAVMLLTFVVYAGRMADMQIVNADQYADPAANGYTRTVAIKATRGEILDRYGQPLAVNREGYNIVFDASYLPKSEINATIKILTGLLSGTGETWRDNLPLNMEAPYDFKSGSDQQVEALKSTLKLNDYATADNCFQHLVKRYDLKNFPDDVKRIIMGVRYTMELDEYSVTANYTFAEDISIETGIKIKESSFELPGVDVEASSIREYVATDISPHIIGQYKAIPADKWETYREKGYSLNDKVGVGGIEEAEEDTLKGQDGEKVIHQDANGNVLSVEVTKEPVPGNTVILSVDSELQRIAEEALEETVLDIQKSEPDCRVGALSVINVNTGEILASASYPTYNYDQLLNHYDELISAENNPMFDRSFDGEYPPGSTFKPAVAAIGLQTGAIGVDETIYCKQHYDYNFYCLGYHGETNVVKALQVSCNSFFYETGRRVGIETLNQYLRQLGLGVDTGVEIGATTGKIAGPETSEDWQWGDIFSAAIGQQNNAFSPLQLAQYTAVIANGGTRYQARLVRQVKSYTLEETIQDNTPVVINQTVVQPAYLDRVKEGMLSVTEDGTAAQIFSDYPIKIGGKTGTAENAQGEPHGVFIAFAPYDNPEIAISVVIEHGLHGPWVAPVARKVFDAYFFPEAEGDETDQTGQPLQ